MHYNGKPMLDTAGNPIHAHGGHMLRYGEYWYWYGEDRRGDAYVSCYRSADLHNWEYRGTVLSAASPTAPMRVRSDLTLRRRSVAGDSTPDLNVISPSAGKVNIERP